VQDWAASGGKTIPADRLRGLPECAIGACDTSMIPPPSPCTRICRIDETTGWCLGCKRTLSEIADWPMLSAREKQDMLARLARRSIR